MHRAHTTALVAALLAATALGGCNGLFGGGIHPQSYVGKEPPMTIILMELYGPESRSLAEGERQALVERGFNAAFTVADDDEAYLCHGLYDGFDDAQYRQDAKALAGIRNRAGGSQFGRPWPGLLPEPTPPTPHKLTDARGKYTVQVGSFDLYGRKKDAVDFTARLRRRGWDAYTFHGERLSLVTIGAFGDIIFDNPYRADNLTDPARIVSTDVKKLLETFPYQTWNGHTFTAGEAEEMKFEKKTQVLNPRTGKAENVVFDMGAQVKSRLVHIPEVDPMARETSQPMPTRTTPPGPMPSPRIPRSR